MLPPTLILTLELSPAPSPSYPTPNPCWVPQGEAEEQGSSAELLTALQEETRQKEGEVQKMEVQRGVLVAEKAALATQLEALQAELMELQEGQERALAGQAEEAAAMHIHKMGELHMQLEAAEAAAADAECAKQQLCEQAEAQIGKIAVLEGECARLEASLGVIFGRKEAESCVEEGDPGMAWLLAGDEALQPRDKEGQGLTEAPRAAAEAGAIGPGKPTSNARAELFDGSTQAGAAWNRGSGESPGPAMHGSGVEGAALEELKQQRAALVVEQVALAAARQEARELREAIGKLALTRLLIAAQILTLVTSLQSSSARTSPDLNPNPTP